MWRVVEVVVDGPRLSAPEGLPSLPTAILETSDPRWARYQVHLTFDFDGTTADLRIVRQVLPTEPESPFLTSRLLQTLPLHSIEQLGRVAVAKEMQGHIQFLDGIIPASPLDREIGAMDTKSPHRPDPDADRDRDLWLSRIAARYVETVGDKMQRTILSEEFEVSLDYVPDLIREARSRGLLTPTRQGKSGGTLTWAAVNLILNDNVKASVTPAGPPVKVTNIDKKGGH